MNNVYEIDDGETHWIVAESEAEARKVWYDLLGKADTEIVIEAMGILPDSKELTISDSGENGETITRTAAEWAAVETGLIGTTAF